MHHHWEEFPQPCLHIERRLEEIEIHKFLAYNTLIKAGDHETYTDIGLNQGTASSGWQFNIAINGVINTLKKGNRSIFLHCDDILIITDSQEDAIKAWHELDNWSKSGTGLIMNPKKSAL